MSRINDILDAIVNDRQVHAASSDKGLEAVLVALANKTGSVAPVVSNTGIVTVDDYGAIADGVTDCTQAFNDALAASYNVYVPFTTAGYLIGHLEVTDKHTLIGSDQRSKLILKNIADWLLITGSDITVKNFDISAQDSTGSMFTINTNVKSSERVYIENIKTYKATNILKDNGGSNIIVNLHLKDITSLLTRGAGIRLTKAYAFINYKNVTIDYINTDIGFNYIGIEMVDNCGSVFEDCDVLGTANTGINTNQIGYKLTNCKAVWMRRCMGDTLDGYGLHVLGNSEYFYISDCSFSLCSNHQIFIENASDIKITNGYCGGRRGLTDAMVNKDAVNLTASARKIKITNLTMTSCTRDGLRSDGAAQVLINNCQMNNNGGYGIRSTLTTVGLYSNCMTSDNAAGNYVINSAYEYIRHLYTNSGVLVDAATGVAVG